MNTKMKAGADLGMYIKKCSLASLLGLACAVVLILIMSAVFGAIYKSEQFYGAFTILLYCVSAFVSGRAAMRGVGAAAALTGALSGLILAIALFALSFCFSGELVSFGNIIINALLMVTSGILGAISFTFKKVRRKKSKRH